MISKPISDFKQEQNNRRIGPRGLDGQFIRSRSKQKRTRDAIHGHRESKDARGPPQHNAQNEYVRTRQIKANPRPYHLKLPTDTKQYTYARKEHGPLTIIATNMTDTEVDRAIDDAKSADLEFFIRDESGAGIY